MRRRHLSTAALTKTRKSSGGTLVKLLAFFFVLASFSLAQQKLTPPEQPNPKTLIPQTTIARIVDEVSGTLAFQHILDLAGYEHDRLAEEYRTTYREATFIETMAKQYALEDVHIERFKMPTKTWDGELGELWLEKPQRRLLLSYRDIAAMLARGSQSADVTSELIYVGHGDKDSDYTGKNVAGKVVLASGATGAVHNLAVRKYGAAGVISFFNLTGKPIDRPDQVAWNNVGGGGGGPQGGEPPKTTFGFNITHRLGMELVDMIERGDTPVVHCKVKATEYDAEMQVPTAVIKGNGESQQEIALVGHLFEGIAKQGAMDNASGSAMALEIARAWKKLIDDGVLPRPRRTARFLWVPEISGTSAYLNRYPDEAKRMVAAIAMDMVGEDASKNRSSLRLMRTPYSVNSFLNDVVEQFFEYVGETNREKIHNRTIAYAYMFPIVDPQGSRDQFYYNIEKHYGSSDHVAFLNDGIPAVLMSNWPDIAYHTSEDRPYNGDPTQLKRAMFIALAAGHVIAGAKGEEAVRISETSAGYAAERTATELRLALQRIGDGESPREAMNLVKQAYIREGDEIRSAAVLAEGDAAAVSRIDALAKNFVETGERADMARLENYYHLLHGSSLITSIQLTADEKEAARLIPKHKPGFGERGVGGSRGAGGPLPGMAGQEARAFADGKRTVLDIRDAVSAEFGPQDTAKFIAYFRQLEKSGEAEIQGAK